MGTGTTRDFRGTAGNVPWEMGPKDKGEEKTDRSRKGKKLKIKFTKEKILW